jgi:perosamine synthetase
MQKDCPGISQALDLKTDLEPIPVNEICLDGNERKYLNECLDTGWISSEGPFVKRFEAELAQQVGRVHGITVNSGSAALDIALQALNLQPDDEVILPTFTIISCAAAIVRAGAKPVLVDCDSQTWNLDVTQIEARINPKTRAIMVVHIYGLPVDMEPVLVLAAQHHLLVIEDAAEAHGQTYRGKPCGSFGDISIFSFYANKHVTTGEGGMIVTDDVQLAERCRSLRNLAFEPGRRFVHHELGWSLRMTNLQAALGVAQLERLATCIQRKQAIGRHYTELLATIPGLQLPVAATAFAENVYWVYGVVIADTAPLNAAEVMKGLSQHKIGTRPFFWPLHEQPVFKQLGWFMGEQFPIAERIARQGFYLPSGSALTDRQVERVAQTLTKLLCP